MLVKVRIERVITQYAEIEVDVPDLEAAGPAALNEEQNNPAMWQDGQISGPMFASAEPV